MASLTFCTQSHYSTQRSKIQLAIIEIAGLSRMIVRQNIGTAKSATPARTQVPGSTPGKTYSYPGDSHFAPSDLRRECFAKMTVTFIRSFGQQIQQITRINDYFSISLCTC